MIWPLYLVASFIVTGVALLLAPILPLFAKESISGADGWLPRWLDWFQTPDNDLDGDKENAWTKYPIGSHMRRVLWLWRNPAYGFEILVLGAQISTEMPILVKGNPHIKNRSDGVQGWYYCAVGHYWNFKWITKVTADRCFMLELGWKLQDYAKYPDRSRPLPEYAQFVCSPRFTMFQEAV